MHISVNTCKFQIQVHIFSTTGESIRCSQDWDLNFYMIDDVYKIDSVLSIKNGT